jgi:hypothetical protein
LANNNKSKVSYGKATQVLSKTFVEQNSDISEDEAEHLIVKCEQKIKAVKEEQAADEKLTAARQIIKDLNSGYKSVLQYEAAKIQFLLGKIEEIQGGEVNPTSGANP